ncbi:MAG: lipoyl synthase [Halanaerobiales bacterium]|nr:lipoyl synthase [Halanaerobiales bacterium]
MTPKYPDWLKKRINLDNDYQETEKILKDLNINTVCQAAFCPNMGECFSSGVATFMILGNICTRNCRFCDIKNGETETVDPKEPENIKNAVSQLNLEHIVITSVTRDDLEDNGSKQFAAVLKSVKKNKAVTIEVLTPDFKGEFKDIKRVVDLGPDVYNHNIETVPRLYSQVRPQAKYNRSIELLKTVKEINSDIITKSGIMLGLGEKKEEVIEVMKDLRKVNCDIITIGQYLQPSPKHAELKEYVTPKKFKEYKNIALRNGFRAVASNPFVRSSYRAKKLFSTVKEIN